MLFLVGVAMTISASFLTTLGILIQKKSYTEPPEKMLKVSDTLSHTDRCE